MENHTKTPRLRAAIGTPDADGSVSSAFETTLDGFTLVTPAVARETLRTALARLAADLPAGSALEARIDGGDAFVTASGLGNLPPLARAAIAERVADALCAVPEGGAQ